MYLFKILFLRKLYVSDLHVFFHNMTRFTLQWAMFELQPHFEKSALNEPIWPWDVRGHKVLIYAHYMHPWSPFLLYDELFWSLICRKVYQITSNDLDMFKIKSTPVHTSYAPGSVIFIHSPLRWATSELWSNFEKSPLNHHKMTLICSRSKVPICICYIQPQGPNFHLFRSVMSHFLSCGSVVRKLHQMTQKWHVQGQNFSTHAHTSYAPDCPHFCLNHSMVSHF